MLRPPFILIHDQKHTAVLKEKRATSGSTSSPRVILLLGLSASVNVHLLAKDLLSLLMPDGVEATSTTVSSPSYKLRATVLVAPHGDLLACMEMAKVADLIAFVASASHLCESWYIDEFGSRCLSVLKSLGLPSTSVLIRDLPSDLKKRHDLKKTCLSSLASEFPEDCKFYSVDSKDDLHKFICTFKEQRLSVPHWRSHRPYLMAEEVNMVAEDGKFGKTTLILSGYVRAHSLSVNQLVHVSGVGDFQMSKLDILKDPFPLSVRKHQDLMDFDESRDIQTWPTEAEMADADKLNSKRLLKKSLPAGTSDYQAAWIVEDTDDEESDTNDDFGEGMLLDEDEHDPTNKESDNESEIDEKQMTDIGEETETDTAMADGDLTREQIEDEIRKLKDAHAEDEEFPDEVDTPLDAPARVRFAKYRGLKSFRTSPWDPKESLPPDYARIFAFDNFAKTQKGVQSKILAMDRGNEEECAAVSSYVRIHIKQVPVDVASKLCVSFKLLPVVACGLLQHESKMSVLHFSIKNHDLHEDPIKTKAALIFNVGFRQFSARPIFSSDNINSDKHKMERFLHAGRFSLASVYAPISSSTPINRFKKSARKHDWTQCCCCWVVKKYRSRQDNFEENYFDWLSSTCIKIESNSEVYVS